MNRSLSLLKALLLSILLCARQCIGSTSTPKLSNTQLMRINRLIMTPTLPDEHMNTLKRVLFAYYEPWALNYAEQFRNNHRYICRHIPSVEMDLYARKGLLNAVRSYRPTKETAVFHLYAVHHLRGQLYYGATEMSPITNVSKKALRRKQSRHARATHETFVWDQVRPVSPRRPDELWEHIYETCDAFTHRCAVYKYDYDFNRLRSNREVAELMACSEETVRKALVAYFRPDFGMHIV